MTDCRRRLHVGVLALQGAFSEHLQLLRKAFKTCHEEDGGVAWTCEEVRTPEQLARCDALIIPGGESTTMALVAARSQLLEPLRRFVKYVLCVPGMAGGGADDGQSRAEAYVGDLRGAYSSGGSGESYEEGGSRSYWWFGCEGE